MESVLVTGGAGYLGSVLVPKLLKLGYKVRVLDNFYYNQITLLSSCSNENLEIIRGDCAQESTLKDALCGMDYIIPLAALVGFPLCEKYPDEAKRVNLEAIKILLKNRKNEQKIIYPCTNSGYGTGLGAELCTENSPINPVSLYGKTKLEAERLILESGNSVTFRFATLFGASDRMRSDLLVNDFVFKAVNFGEIEIFEGEFKRNFLHIDDAANAFVFAINNFDKMNGKTYNCGLSDTNISKIELCEKIKNHIPSFVFKQGVGSDPDKRNYIVSNELIESLGWKANHSLDEGIDELIKAYKILGDRKYGNV